MKKPEISNPSNRPRQERPFNDRPRSDRPQGDRPFNDRPRSDRPQGDRPFNDRARSDRQEGNRPHSDRPREDRPYNNRPRGDKPRTDRPKNDRPYSGKENPKARHSGERSPQERPKIEVPEGFHEYFVACPRGLDRLLVTELKSFGAIIQMENRLGVNIYADLKVIYNIVYRSRIASRVLRPIIEFFCPSDEVLYNTAIKMDWSAYMDVTQTFKIASHVRSSNMTHSQYAGQKLKDALCDYFREKVGERPNVSKDEPDVAFDLQITKDQAQICLAYSVGVLHRRGYRLEAVDAPIKENLAAGILDLCGWGNDPENTAPLYDAFCGSGTFLIEAALKYTRTPAGFWRAKQGFEQLKDFNAELWDEVKSEALAQVRPLPAGLISGSDLAEKAVLACMTNLKQAGFNEVIDVQTSDFKKIRLNKEAWVISNPPYGVRLEKDVDRLLLMYKHLGQWLYRDKPAKAVILLAFAEVKKAMALWSKERWLLDNGDLDLSVEEFEFIETEHPAHKKTSI